jgi:hypothetical protein
VIHVINDDMPFAGDSGTVLISRNPTAQILDGSKPACEIGATA